MPNTCKGQNMGIGPLGGADVVFKRKFRWLFSVQTPCSFPNIAPYIVKLAARPNLTIEETEINFLHQKTWIPGKAAWETITVTFYDVGGFGDAISSLSGLYSWLATVYNFTDPVGLCMSSKIKGYAGNVQLDLLDGCGSVMETWHLTDAWPQAINFGELDYSSSEEVTIEVTLRYSAVQYIAGSCGANINPCCLGCE